MTDLNRLDALLRPDGLIERLNLTACRSLVERLINEELLK